MKKRLYMLIVLDGWGIAPEDYPPQYNAVALARKPNFQFLWENYPHTAINTSGRDVGLPAGVMGNSEVGHLNLGAGRIVWQEITRIDRAIEKDGLMSIEPIRKAMEGAIRDNTKLHLMGLVSDGAVHSMDRHYEALLRLAHRLQVPSEQVFIHCFLDGRDTPPKSGIGYVKELHQLLEAEQLGRIATVMGRYYAMDRDKRWERIELAYRAIANGQGIEAQSPEAAVAKAYQRGETDEFVRPTVVKDENKKPTATVDSGDYVIYFNFRGDRARQLSHALTDKEFPHFQRPPGHQVHLVCMTQYEEGINCKVAFPQEYLKETFGEIVARAGLRQLRIAETEKYAHVTFFFSGGRENPFENEDRILIPSPRVPTYDHQPEMSAPAVAERVCQEMLSRKYEVMILNFANPDMVGHTGILEAARKAIEAVDSGLGKIYRALQEVGGVAIVTADHGNAEEMWDFEHNSPQTQHTTGNLVPFILVADELKDKRLREGGRLCDVVPTLMAVMGMKKPAVMTGESLII